VDGNNTSLCVCVRAQWENTRQAFFSTSLAIHTNTHTQHTHTHTQHTPKPFTHIRVGIEAVIRVFVCDVAVTAKERRHKHLVVWRVGLCKNAPHFTRKPVLDKRRHLGQAKDGVGGGSF
jgi:hypothetical protein